MKKYIIFFFTLCISTLLAFILPTKAEAYEEVLDQSQTTGGACLTAYSGYNLNQTFIPVKNIITRIDVKMKNRVGGSNIILILKDEGTGQIVVQTNQRMDDGDGWESFNLVGDALGYMLDTDHQHSIWIGTGYYSGDTPPCWLYSSSDAYGNGSRRKGSTDYSGDFTFITYGYDVDMGRDNPEPPPPQEDPPSEEPAQEDPPQDDQPGVSTIPDEAQEKEDVEILEASEDINEPTLQSVIIDNSIVEVEEGIVLVEDEETMKITGTTDPGDTVAVFIGENAYTAIADEDGNWYVVFSISELEDGTYDIDAQSTNGELGSAKINLFTLIKGSQDVVSNEIEEDTNTGLWYNITEGDLRWVSITVLFLLGSILLIILLKRKKKEEEEKGTDARNK